MVRNYWSITGILRWVIKGYFKGYRPYFDGKSMYLRKKIKNV